MTKHQTIQFASQTLRKTQEGWQYLSEGLEGAPDCWCDATSVIGPFGGSGVNALLDEVAATLANAAARESELVDVLQHIRGKSNCSDAWDAIDEVVPYDERLYS